MADGKKAKKSKGEAKPKAAKKNKAKVNIDGGVEALSRLVDHPLVTDLLAVGAMAAVAAIAEAGAQSKAGAASADRSRKAVKAAGKAAAAAIGQRLLKEVGGLGAKAAAKK
ncbi:MAG: hypothetical protein M3N02_00955 [Pseudomonadota bacterium]|nr:hypothetical protein [Pseudomonadota bacterium]